ncbi:DMT family transporter [Photobacterium alginatilyticum]|uniref:DMT family transporter n=1 Tax=Photobacterium alginatilyticum TaxID=1775171 RepID=A0ABW9YBJ6_9GAMM|nr:DMT family transporter [Photobacterium alginatilyticum]NBI51159.1 DMT family transporter [Photobacterium alginatilyticum]
MAVRMIPFIFVILWSSGFIGARFGLPYAEPATFLLIRMVANIVLFILLMFVLRAHLPRGKALFHSMMSGLLIHGFYLGGTYEAISLGMPAGLCSLLVGLQPILTAVIIVMVWNEKTRLSQWIGLLIGFIGIGLVLQGNMEWQQEGSRKAAYIFAAFALLGITLGTLYQKKFCQGVDMVGGAVWQYIAAAMLFLPVALTTETMVVDWTPEFIFAMVWAVVVLSGIAILLLLYMVDNGEASKVATTFYLVPPMTAFQAWLVFDESFDGYGVIGFVLAAIAVYLVTRKPKLPAGDAQVAVRTQS